MASTTTQLTVPAREPVVEDLVRFALRLTVALYGAAHHILPRPTDGLLDVLAEQVAGIVEDHGLDAGVGLRHGARCDLALPHAVLAPGESEIVAVEGSALNPRILPGSDRGGVGC